MSDFERVRLLIKKIRRDRALSSDSEAFIHLCLGRVLKLADEAIYQAVTRGERDGGIDAIVIDKKEAHVILCDYASSVFASKLRIPRKWLKCFIETWLAIASSREHELVVNDALNRKIAKIKEGFRLGDGHFPCTFHFFTNREYSGIPRAETVTLGVMDGLAGLEMVFKEEFPKAEVQRCEVHVARNVLAKVPKKLKQGVADDMRSIFYASSKEKAKEFFAQFKDRWEKEVPSAVKCLKNSLDACLTFFKFPPEEWQALRTTNIIERLNKEFKRRTKTMEIVAGENAYYRLLAFISLKMEMHWKRILSEKQPFICRSSKESL